MLNLPPTTVAIDEDGGRWLLTTVVHSTGSGLPPRAQFTFRLLGPDEAPGLHAGVEPVRFGGLLLLADGEGG